MAGIKEINIYLLVQVFRTSFKGARRPLGREPDVYLNDDIIEANFSIDFSAMSEYRPIWDISHPNLSCSFLVSTASSGFEVHVPKF